MSNGSNIVRDRQRAVREQLDLRGITLKVVAAHSGIPYSTLCSYLPGNERGQVEKTPAELPSGALFQLCGAIPTDLLNLLLPDGFAIVCVPEGVDYDSISSACREFIDCKDKAHHPDSEAGRDIGPGEEACLAAVLPKLRVA